MDWNEHNPSPNLRPDSSSIAGRRFPDGRPSFATSRSSGSSHGRNAGYGYEHEHRISHESKPRLSKEQQDILERHFQAQPKPSTVTKKGFADNLGVPLDKINNWFQNRRAKVKQDAKKQHNSAQAVHNVFDSNFMANNGQPSNDSSFIDPAFYQTINTMIDPNNLTMPTDPFLPGDHNQTSYNDTADGHGSFQTQLGPSINEPYINDSPEIFNQFFGLDNNTYGMSNDVDRHALWAFSKQFNPPFEGFNHYPANLQDFEASNTSTSASVFTRSSGGNTSPYVSTFPHDKASAFVRGTGEMGSSVVDPQRGLTSLQPELPNYSYSQGVETSGEANSRQQPGIAQSSQPHHLQTNATLSPGQLQVPQQRPNPAFAYRNPNQPTVLPSQSIHHDQTQQAQSETPQHGKAEEAPSAQAAPGQAEGLSISTAVKSDVPKDEDDVSQSTTLKSPTTGSGLASRRQKRPAALGAAALRTVSQSDLQSPSKTAIPAPPASDASLRRIKSSGVLTGRVQKSGTGSAPRSPRNFSFAEGVGSPRASRKASSTSLNAVADAPSSGSNTVPLTPLSPREVPPLPFSKSNNNSRMHITIPEHGVEQGDSVWANMPTTADSTYTSVWSHMPLTSDTIPSYTSPPISPMDYGPFSQMTIQNSAYYMPGSAPQSAPAWQTSFQLPPGFHPYQGAGYPPATHQQADAFRPYTSGENNMGMMQPPTQEHFQYNVQGENYAQELGHTQPGFQASPDSFNVYPQTYGSQTVGQHTPMSQVLHQPPGSQQQDVALSPPRAQPQSAVGSPSLEVRSNASKSPPQNASRSPSAPRTKPSTSELLIHEYSPMEPADPSNLPPKMRITQPKEYIFTNHGPEHYNSP